MATYRLRVTRRPEWIATFEAPDQVKFTTDFEATPVGQDGKPMLGSERNFGVDLYIDGDLLVTGRWGMYSSAERAVHLGAIALELVQKRGLPRSGQHVLHLDRQAEGGRFAYGSPFDPPMVASDEVLELDVDEARWGADQ